MIFLISSMAVTINLNSSLTNIPYSKFVSTFMSGFCLATTFALWSKFMLVLFSDHKWDWCCVKTLLKLPMLLCWILVNFTCIIMILGTLWMLLLLFLDTQWNRFPINLGTSKSSYFLPKLLESYNINSVHRWKNKGIAHQTWEVGKRVAEMEMK